MQYYLMLILSAVLSAGDLVLAKLYQKRNGSSMENGMLFNLLVGACSAVIFLCVNKFRVQFTLFSVVLALVMTLIAVIYISLGFKIMEQGKAAYYTFFRMTGAMTIPYLWGLFMLHESFSVWRTLGLMMVMLAVLFIHGDKQKLTFQNTLICLSVFLLAGSMSIISKEHSINPAAVKPIDYVILTSMAKLVICGPYLLLMKLKNRGAAKEAPPCDRKKAPVIFLLCFGSALITGIAYFLQLVSAAKLPATVLYPIITGGTITFSALAGRLFFGERMAKKGIAAIVLCVLGTCLFL